MFDESRLRTIRPLIIEDEKETMDSIFSLFDKMFDEFYIARNGEEGLYRFYKENPDVIITDLQMPFMSGFRMIERIRIENSTIPVIIITAYSEKEHIEKARSLNVLEYFVKPFDVDGLFKTIYQSCYPSFSEKIDLDQFTL